MTTLSMVDEINTFRNQEQKQGPSFQTYSTSHTFLFVLARVANCPFSLFHVTGEENASFQIFKSQERSNVIVFK